MAAEKGKAVVNFINIKPMTFTYESAFLPKRN